MSNTRDAHEQARINGMFETIRINDLETFKALNPSAAELNEIIVVNKQRWNMFLCAVIYEGTTILKYMLEMIKGSSIPNKVQYFHLDLAFGSMMHEKFFSHVYKKTSCKEIKELMDQFVDLGIDLRINFSNGSNLLHLVSNVKYNTLIPESKPWCNQIFQAILGRVLNYFVGCKMSRII